MTVYCLLTVQRTQRFSIFAEHNLVTRTQAIIVKEGNALIKQL